MPESDRTTLPSGDGPFRASTWRWLAAGLYAYASCDDPRRFIGTKQIALHCDFYNSLAPVAEKLTGLALGDRDQALAAIRDRLLGPVIKDDGPPRYFAHPERHLEAKCAFIALALTSGRLDLVAPSDLPRTLVALNALRGDIQAVDDVVDSVLASPDPHDACPVPEMGNTLPFRFVWQPFGRTGRGTRALAAADGFMPMTLVADAEAPIAWRLIVPGGELPVRDWNGQALRPLLAPGTWRVAERHDVVRAAASGECWNDSPFRGRPDFRGGIHSAWDVALPTKGSHKRDGEALVHEEERCLARAGRLFCVDGVPHEACPSPTLHLSIAGRSPESWQAGFGYKVVARWRLGERLSSTDVQETFRFRADIVSHADVEGLPAFPLDMHDHLVAAIETLGRILKPKEVDASPVLSGLPAGRREGLLAAVGLLSPKAVAFASRLWDTDAPSDLGHVGLWEGPLYVKGMDASERLKTAIALALAWVAMRPVPEDDEEIMRSLAFDG